MSNPATIQSPTPPAVRIRAAITHAARATGTDFSYLVAQARLESGMNPHAEARTSSASGLYQFIEGTWLRTLDKHGAAHGLDHLAGAIEQRGGRAIVRDPAMRERIMALRHDPEVSAVMAGALAQDNRAALLPVLGREPDAAELYLAHFLGAGGAAGFLRGLARDPHASAAALLPEAAAANRAIFYNGGEPRSLAQVMHVIQRRMDRALADEGVPSALAGPVTGQTIHAGLPARIPAAASLRQPTPPSMSRMLEASFGLDHRADSNAPAHVRAAYGKLKAFAL